MFFPEELSLLRIAIILQANPNCQEEKSHKKGLF
jgi:hypothetical protein